MIPIMRIFILEDSTPRIMQFRKILKNHQVTVARDMMDVPDAWRPPYDLMLLDHDLGGQTMTPTSNDNTGSGFCRWLWDRYKNEGTSEIPRAIIHSYNHGGAEWMKRYLLDMNVEASCLPFGPTLLRVLNTLNDPVEPEDIPTTKYDNGGSYFD